jgi:hypothetical protein
MGDNTCMYRNVFHLRFFRIFISDIQEEHTRTRNVQASIWLKISLFKNGAFSQDDPLRNLSGRNSGLETGLHQLLTRRTSHCFRFQGVPLNAQCKGQILTDTYRYLQILTYRYLLTGTYRLLQILTDTYRYLQTLTDTYRHLQICTVT